MKIEMQSRGIELTEHLKAYVDRRVRFALSRHSQHVRRIHVRLADLNGPRGGLDSRCQLEVFVHQGDPIIVEVQDMEATKLSFDTNVYGYLRMARAVLPGMRSKFSGLIVNVSSQQGRMIMPGSGIYSATKFAVESMCEQLAYELVPFSIDVLIVEPGGFPTKIGENRARYSAELYERADERHKQGYPGLVAGMKPSDGPPRSWPNAPDPMDVPRAIAEIAAMPPGTRPLRRPVHPGLKPQLEINRICREAQLLWMSNKPYSEWVRAVYD